MYMKTKILFLLIAIAMSVNVFSQEKGNVLIAYFSATGTTASAAEKLASATGGTLFRITPAQPYTSADLDWNNKQSRSSVEMDDPKARPALKGKVDNLAAYDVVFLGYPIWWGVAPRIINTFIESHDLKGKKLVPFATSGGSSISERLGASQNLFRPRLERRETAERGEPEDSGRLGELLRFIISNLLICNEKDNYNVCFYISRFPPLAGSRGWRDSEGTGSRPRGGLQAKLSYSFRR